ncbi:MAG: tetratricopeptide repeat protein, partial [Okeania sp. SIO2D1]|nr:tetratricopeptide repeat protein [Okeania sp. SIO2D1]
QALAAYDKALEIKPDYTNSIINLGLVKYEIGKIPHF